MAYGEIRHSEFRDNVGGDWRISILKDGHTGSSTSFKCGGQGFELKYNGEGDDIDSSIKSSECTFVFFSESSTDDTFILDLVNGDESDYLLEIKSDVNNDGTFSSYWKGVLVVDNAELEDQYYPQPFKIRAIDGISILKGKKVTELENLWNIDGGVSGGVTEDFQIDSANGPTWGGSVYQHRSLVLACLRLIPTLDLYNTTETFNYNISCWENQKMANQGTIYRDPLWGVASRSDVFYKQNNDGEYRYQNCYEVLKSILDFYNMRLFMHDGYWVTIQVGSYEQMKTANEFYVRYDKNDFGQTKAGNGTLTYNIGDLLEDGDSANDYYKIAEPVYAYDKQIKEININIKGAPEDIYSLNHTWATNEELTISLDPNPSANDYIQTYAQVTAGDNFTFYAQFKGKITRLTQGNPNPNYTYIAHIFLIAKVGNYYLVFNDADQKFEWSTTEQPVYNQSNDSFWMPVPGVGNFYYFNNYIGDQSLDNMDPVPVDGQIELYAYWDLWAYNNGNFVDVATLNSNIQVKLDRLINIYGMSSHCVELDVFQDEEQYSTSEYIIQNAPGGSLLKGGLEIDRNTIFSGDGGIFRNSSIYTWNGTTGVIFDEWQYDQTPNWRNRNEEGSYFNLPTYKGIEMIGLQPSNIKLLRATLINKQVSGNPRYFRFRDLFEYNDDYYIPNGFTFYANDSLVVGEFVSIEYDIANASSTTPLNNGGGNNGNILIDVGVGLSSL